MAACLVRRCHVLASAHVWGRKATVVARPSSLSKLARPCSSQALDHTVCRFPIPDRGSLPQDIHAVMTQVEEKGGFVPNVFKVLSRRPAEFRAFFAYYDALMNKDNGNLSKADREAIVVATSAANGCLYCVVAHSALHRIFSKNTMLADQIAINWRCAELDERLRCILDFALHVRDSRPVAESQLDGLRRHGLDDEDIWDIGAIVALFALSNRMAHLADMRPNAEFYLMGRVRREQSVAPKPPPGGAATSG